MAAQLWVYDAPRASHRMGREYNTIGDGDVKIAARGAGGQ
jgi:hypothetical protein